MEKCEFCGKEDERVYMWPHGYVLSDEQFLCQDCHEAEVDADFWASPLLALWKEPEVDANGRP